VSTAEPPDEPERSSPGSSGPPPDTPEADAPSADAPPSWSAATSGAAPPVPPAPTVTAPDTWVAPAPPKKRKLAWLWVLLGVLVLIAALVVVGVVLFVRGLAGPMDATDQVLEQVKAASTASTPDAASRHYETAYRLSCSEDRDRYTIEQYTQVFVNTKDARGAIKSYDVNYADVDGDTAEVRYDLEFADGTSDRYRAAAHKEHGDWRACLFPARPG
jgi:hypothetical protein